MSGYIIKMDVENLKPHPVNKTIYDWEFFIHKNSRRFINFNWS